MSSGCRTKPGGNGTGSLSENTAGALGRVTDSTSPLFLFCRHHALVSGLTVSHDVCFVKRLTGYKVGVPL